MSESNSGTIFNEEEENLFADVILPLHLPKPFTYKIDKFLKDKVFIGSRVLVEFGKRKILTGIVNDVHKNIPPLYSAKPILEVLEETPLINEKQLKLFHWMAEYYMCSTGEVINAALPAGLRLSSNSKIKLNPLYKENVNLADVSSDEVKLINLLEKKQSLTYDEIGSLFTKRQTSLLIKLLLSKDLIILFEEVNEKYASRVIRKIKIAPSIFNNEQEFERLFKQVEKKELQTNALLAYLRHVPFRTALNDLGLAKSILIKEKVSNSALNTLIKQNVFEEFLQPISRFETSTVTKELPNLIDFQQKAKLEIGEAFKSKETVLLHGITGSGKTEIYINLIHEAINGGSQVLYLLPEIAITTQLVERLKVYFGEKMGVYHSKFSDNERVEVWHEILAGKLSFIVGVRSSVFLPFDNLGLIIIDEEHEYSFKQYEPAPRYHARDTALMLSRLHHSKTLLGTATPSLESYYQAKSGNWGLVTMSRRYLDTALPEIILADTLKEKKQKTIRGDFSYVTIQKLQDRLSRQEQSILFQNRRGYAPILSCDECAHVPKCINCSVSLTYHLLRAEISCHYCGHTETIPTKCPICGSGKIKTVGYGTEKIEDDLKLMLPNARIQRMDLDSTRKKDSFKKLIQELEKGSIDILVGTQMVVKGLDFEKVTFVGVFDIDRLIHFPDFRSLEKTFQVLTQVSGRAGRRTAKGEVVIQTNNPGLAIFQKVKNNDYNTFYKEEIQERERFNYPPFVRLIKIICKDVVEKVCSDLADEISSQLIQNLGRVRVLGPEKPLVNRIRNYFIQEIIIKLEKGKLNLPSVKNLILEVSEKALTKKEYKKSIVIFDVDPL